MIDFVARVVASFLAAVLIGTFLSLALLHVVPSVPSCSEDEVIVGVGNFSNGYWPDYKCIHFEDVK